MHDQHIGFGKQGGVPVPGGRTRLAVRALT
jgi:hypothetical protein